MVINEHSRAKSLQTLEMGQLIVQLPDAGFWKKWLLRAAGILGLLYIAYVVRQIWLPLGLEFLLATVLDPVVDRMEQRGWRRPSATVFIFFSFVFIVVGLIVLAFPFVMDQVETVQQSLSKFFPDPSAQGLTVSFSRLKIPHAMVGPLVKVVVQAQTGLLKSSTLISGYGIAFVGNLVWMIFVPIVGFYALRDYHLLLGKGLLLAPREHRNSVQSYVSDVSAIFARYLRGLAIVSFLNGVATWLLLTVLHVPNSLLLGVIAGLFYSVPYVGAMITIVVTAAIAFVGGGVSMLVTSVVASVILHQLVFDQMVSPRILGNQVGIHPIVSIVALLIGNLLFGIIGMILAVPVAACLQIGVLALIPKLAVEIDLHAESMGPVEDESEIRADAIKAEHLKSDAQETLHGNILFAVENLESQLDSEAASSDS
jgi:predicted PurR-regulated permease PerM